MKKSINTLISLSLSARALTLSVIQPIVPTVATERDRALVDLESPHLFADSAQTEYCTTFLLSVCSCVTGVTSHISHIYKGINANFLAKTRPEKTIFSALTNLTIDFDSEYIGVDGSLMINMAFMPLYM